MRVPRFVLGALVGIALTPPSLPAQATETRACPDPGPESRQALAALWVQDDMGPVLTHSRRYRFAPDGTYEFVFTSRPSGSRDERVLVRQQGRYEIRLGCLLITPEADSTTVRAWRIERDPYVGDIQLVFLRPDGTRDVYYRR